VCCRTCCFKSVIAEPGTLNRVTAEILKYQTAGHRVDKQRLADTLHQTIGRHTSLGHHSEIAWALWAAILFQIRLDNTAAKIVAKQTNSVIALLALDARKRKLLPAPISVRAWQAFLSKDDLYGEQWLLAYEANRKGWLTGTADYVSSDPCFGFLKKNKVTFYDERASDRARAMTRKLKRPLIFLPTSPIDVDF
jgi:hypothetical protein